MKTSDAARAVDVCLSISLGPSCIGAFEVPHLAVIMRIVTREHYYITDINLADVALITSTELFENLALENGVSSSQTFAFTIG